MQRWGQPPVTMKSSKYLLIFGLCFAAGCSATQKSAPQATGETRAEVISAMEKVVGAVSGQEVNEQDLRKLNQQIQKDPEAKSAVESINNTLSGQVTVKYCPVDGERYNPKFLECPIHHVPLKILTE